MATMRSGPSRSRSVQAAGAGADRTAAARSKTIAGIADRLAMGTASQRSMAYRTAERLIDAMERLSDRPVLLLVIADHPDAVRLTACKVHESMRGMVRSASGADAGHHRRQLIGTEWMPDVAESSPRWEAIAHAGGGASMPVNVRVAGAIRGSSSMFDELLQAERSRLIDDDARERFALAPVRAAYAACPDALTMIAEADAIHLAWPRSHHLLLAAGNMYGVVIRELASLAIRECADPRTGAMPDCWGRSHREAVLSACAGDRSAYRDWLVEQVDGGGPLPEDVAISWLAEEAGDAVCSDADSTGQGGAPGMTPSL